MCAYAWGRRAPDVLHVAEARHPTSIYYYDPTPRFLRFQARVARVGQGFSERAADVASGSPVDPDPATTSRSAAASSVDGSPSAAGQYFYYIYGCCPEMLRIPKDLAVVAADHRTLDHGNEDPLLAAMIKRLVVCGRTFTGYSKYQWIVVRIPQTLRGLYNPAVVAASYRTSVRNNRHNGG